MHVSEDSIVENATRVQEPDVKIMESKVLVIFMIIGHQFDEVFLPLGVGSTTFILNRTA